MKLLWLTALLFATTSFALTNEELQRVRFDQHLGQNISRNVLFHDSTGRQVKIGDLLDGRRPVIVVLGYFRCPMLCTLVNDGLIKTLQEVRANVGRDFNLIDLSIDPQETPSLAAARKAEYLKQYGRAGASDGWHFLVGDRAAVDEVANECGFRYAYDVESGEFAHPSGLVILTPDGTISRYLLGVNFDATELLTALDVARRGERGSITHQLALLCFHYNPVTGKYSLAILKTLRVASAIMLVAGAVVIARLSRRRPSRAHA
jgi:protein SCO1/2